jgi:hypothetical protein
MVVSPRLGQAATWWTGKFETLDSQREKVILKSTEDEQPQTGWKLIGCNVEEYPFGAGSGTFSSKSLKSLRLIPKQENKDAGGGFRKLARRLEGGY